MSVLCKDCMRLELTPASCCLLRTIGSLSCGEECSAALSISRTGVPFFPLSFLDEDENSSESDERTLLLTPPFCRGCRTNVMSWCLLIPESLQPSEQNRNVSSRLRSHVSQVLVTPLAGLGCGRSFRNTTLALLIMYVCTPDISSTFCISETRMTSW
jgi:predicted Zn-ribbon and HTH transcriptional regulator